jgi:hypothetical protein
LIIVFEKLKDTLIFSDKRVLLIKKENRATPYKNGLFISFFVFLPFLILTAFLVFKWNKLKEYRNRSETVSEG